MLYNAKLPQNRNDGRGAEAVSWLLERYEGRSPWSFCWRIMLEMHVVLILVGLLMAGVHAVLDILFSGFEDSWRFNDGGYGLLPEQFDSAGSALETILMALLMIALFPAFETLIQAIPIIIARKYKAGLGVQVLASAALFAALVFLIEPDLYGFAVGILGGLYLGFTFAYWQRESPATAWWMTMALHGLRIALSIPFMLAA